MTGPREAKAAENHLGGAHVVFVGVINKKAAPKENFNVMMGIIAKVGRYMDNFHPAKARGDGHTERELGTLRKEKAWGNQKGNISLESAEKRNVLEIERAKEKVALFAKPPVTRPPSEHFVHQNDLGAYPRIPAFSQNSSIARNRRDFLEEIMARDRKIHLS